jgi:hypothetical protein
MIRVRLSQAIRGQPPISELPPPSAPGLLRPGVRISWPKIAGLQSGRRPRPLRSSLLAGSPQNTVQLVPGVRASKRWRTGPWSSTSADRATGLSPTVFSAAPAWYRTSQWRSTPSKPPSGWQTRPGHGLLASTGRGTGTPFRQTCDCQASRCRTSGPKSGHHSLSPPPSAKKGAGISPGRKGIGHGILYNQEERTEE